MNSIIDELVDDYYSTPWNSSLVFSACVLCLQSESYEEHRTEACNIDIFQYTTNSNTFLKNWVVRFDPDVYKVDHKVDDKFGNETDGFKLIQAITKMLFEGGQGFFVSNGVKSRKIGISERNICCSRHKLYQNRNNDTEAVVTRRKIQLRKVPGKHNATNTISKKCTATSLPVSANEKCTCQISIGQDKNDETKDVVENVKVWIQNSLMKTVENEEEYNISKALLLTYIKSTADKIGQTNVNGIMNFLRDHVFKHEERFASYNYTSCRSFGDYSNTPLEGTNGGLKYCNFAVKPNMQISKSASYMICQDENKYNDKLRVAYSNFTKTKLYGFDGESGKATRRIVPGALGEMAQQIDLASYHCSLRIDQANWVVRFAKEERHPLNMELMPRFHRLRYVQRDECGGFHCTCPYAEVQIQYKMPIYN